MGTVTTVGTVVRELARELTDRLRWHRRWQVGAVAVFAVFVGVSVLGVTVLPTIGRGGAPEPERVGHQLVAALERGDLIGVFDLLAPDERASYLAPVQELERGWQENGTIVSGGLADLVDVTIEDVKITSDVVDDLTVNLRLRGAVTFTANSDRVVNLDQLLTVVLNSDGRWYLSLGATIAETLRTRSGAEPDPASAVTAVGHSTPERAVVAWLSALSSSDAKGLIAGLDPVEAQHLQRYASVYLESAQRALSDQGSWNLSRINVETVRSSTNRAQVRVSEITATIARNGYAVTVTADSSGCYQVDDGTGQEAFCADDIAADAVGSGVNPELLASVARVSARTVTATRRDGLWYLSPAGTIVGVIAHLLAPADGDDLAGLLETLTS